MKASRPKDLRARLDEVVKSLERAKREQSALMDSMGDGENVDFAALRQKIAKIDLLQGEWMGTAAKISKRKKA
jgi:hypothetical protein